MIDKQIAEMRAFNRFYTAVIGLLDKHILGSNYTLPEVRILYEIYHHENIQAGDIMKTMDIDKGYLSRLLKSFIDKKLVVKKRDPADGRAAYLLLTAKGKKEFETLNQVQNDEIKNMMQSLSAEDRETLVHYMTGIKTLLQKTTE